ncbi:hypothetical protein G7K_1201-t1 [Saitoella complicata NRRL Y-17804]|uniref:Uncharacterized protein n=1 Tax=Saitoella complicata (strain BCRC 22490 / CBS 7301 / JCM 7358 / NBRC 10748 / NRRL Y-17804) TaxID=698492 RepID=A0A0E9NAU0_SAICN|nr:hypothetical protein G7K_1201-t1 [Saitoella complicata NRRL Y-17804]
MAFQVIDSLSLSISLSLWVDNKFRKFPPKRLFSCNSTQQCLSCIYLPNNTRFVTNYPFLNRKAGNVSP